MVIDLKRAGFGSSVTPPPRKSLGQFIFDNLGPAIARGEIPPGYRITENNVAKALGISRTPVREAFHKLEREGLIKLTPQGGYAVAALTAEEVEDIYAIRGILESYAARLATIKHNKEDLHFFEEKLQEAEQCLKEDRLKYFPKIYTEFHRILYAVSDRPKLIEMIRHLENQTYRFRVIIFSEIENARISNRIHRKMITALKKRDADKVERLMKNHIAGGEKIVLENLKSGRL